MQKEENQNKWVELFLDYQQHERGFSSHTVRAYKLDLSQFLLYLNTRLVSLDELRPLHVREFLASSQRNNCSGSIARKLSTLRSFYKFLERHGYIPQNPLNQMKTPKIQRKLPIFLTIEEVNKLLEAPSNDSILGKRDRAILELLYGSGIRVGELISLQVDDIVFRSAMLKVKGKRKKERLVPINTSCMAALRDYLKVRPLAIEQTLFLNRFSTPLNERSVRRLLKKYLSQTHLSLNISPHSLRHTYATHLLDAGANLRAVQELLGHASLSATQIYTHITTSQLLDVYRKNHPRA
jgi:tyrosine recombinase XerC